MAELIKNFEGQLVFAALVSVLSFALPAVAETIRYPEMALGIDSREVLTAVGSPLERVYQETKRQERWIYRGAEAIFREGRLIEWKVAGDLVSLPVVLGVSGSNSAANPARLAGLPSRVVVNKMRKYPIREILTDVQNQASSQDGGSTPGPSGGPAGRPANSFEAINRQHLEAIKNEDSEE